MHIVYIHQYFATPSGTTGTRSYEFARRWVAKGHKVTMLTSTAQLSRQELAAARGWFIKRLRPAGIDVLAVSIAYRQQMGLIRRILAFVGFLVVCSVLILLIRDVDVVYATSTPLTVGVPALVGKRFRKLPFVFEVRDQWPEIPIELGILRNKILISVLLRLERLIYKHSRAIVALSPGQAEGVRQVAGEGKPIRVIPNCCDLQLFRPELDGSEVRRERGWADKLVLLHAGAMGKVNSLEFVIRAAERLRGYEDVLFVLVGDGKDRPRLERMVAEQHLHNVCILPAVPKHELPRLYAGADVGLVIIGNFPIIEHNSANKFFDSLSAGKPILLNYSGWQRDLIESHQVGFGTRLCDLDEFVEKVKLLRSRRSDLIEMGRRARKLAVERFDRDVLAMEALAVVSAQVRHGKAGRSSPAKFRESHR